MKKTRLKKFIQEKLPLVFYFIAIITMALLVGNDDLNKKSATESEVHIAQIQTVN